MNEYPYGSDMGQGSSNNMMGFFVGALVGAGVALLLAPAPGGHTRRRLADTAKRPGLGPFVIESYTPGQSR